MSESKRAPIQGPFETKWGTVLIERVKTGDYIIAMKGVALGRVVKRQGKGWRTEPDIAVIYTSKADAINGSIAEWYVKNKRTQTAHGIGGQQP